MTNRMNWVKTEVQHREDRGRRTTADPRQTKTEQMTSRWTWDEVDVAFPHLLRATKLTPYDEYILAKIMAEKQKPSSDEPEASHS
jgi:hypothetical protein